jgi:molybdopterin/thiamine biosynthesis adenylyltransferase
MSYREIVNRTNEIRDVYRPQFFYLSDEKDKTGFEELARKEHIFIHDEIYDQLKELLKSRHPSRILKPEDYDGLISTHLAGKDLDLYGVWVYYPWNNRLLHILDEEEFIEVRTSRNQYKITVEERALLATKKVGVVGLSVGQSVAVTMAMERSFGELRLADFDVLELTNLNRIRTGLHNLGIKKVISVAREIAEMDPFIKMVLFQDGLTEENMESFFMQGGKLDTIIDECDGVDIKFQLRQVAKRLHVPVLMEASDRGTIDVERFDLEPDRPILHGFIDHLDISKLKFLKTNEERIPYLAPMVGIDTMSTRLKASAVEVGKSITTWPQLASAVVLGGGAVADIWRRIALNQYHESGRYFVDMDELVGNTRPPKEADNPEAYIPYKPMTADDAVAVTGHTGAHPGSVKLNEEQLRTIIDAAITAPSGGNAQPWKWVYDNSVLSLIFDRYYGYSFMDFQDRASLIALGSAIENLVLKAHQLSLEVKVDYYPKGTSNELIAYINFFEKGAVIDGLEAHVEDDLESQLYLRHTNRKITTRIPLKNNILDELKVVAATTPGAELKFFEDEEQLKEIGLIISATDRFRLLYPQSHRDFIQQEMRWTIEEANERKTGMDVNTLELRPSELVGLRLIKDPGVVAFLRKIGGGKVFEGASEKIVNNASAMGFLTMPGYSENDYLAGGRVAQRVWLKATQQHIGFQPMNVPFAFFSRLKYDRAELPSEIIGDLEMLYERFKKVMNYSGTEGEIYLFRIFAMDEPAINPLRRTVDQVLIINN